MYTGCGAGARRCGWRGGRRALHLHPVYISEATKGFFTCTYSNVSYTISFRTVIFVSHLDSDLRCCTMSKKLNFLSIVLHHDMVQMMFSNEFCCLHNMLPMTPSHSIYNYLKYTD